MNSTPKASSTREMIQKAEDLETEIYAFPSPWGMSPHLPDGPPEQLTPSECASLTVSPGLYTNCLGRYLLQPHGALDSGCSSLLSTLVNLKGRIWRERPQAVSPDAATKASCRRLELQLGLVGRSVGFGVV